MKNKTALVLKSGAWDRIKRAARSPEPPDTTECERRAELNERSKKLSSSWENTVQGMQKKKLEERIRELEEKEEAAVKIDIEEAKYQAQKRREAIAHANDLLFHETEGAREIHAAMMLSRVLKEREKQMEMIEAERKMEIEERKNESPSCACLIPDRPQKPKSSLVVEYNIPEIPKEESKTERRSVQEVAEQLRLEMEKLAEEERRRKIAQQHHNFEVLKKCEEERRRYHLLRQNWEKAEDEKRKIYNEMKRNIDQKTKERDEAMQKARAEKHVLVGEHLNKPPPPQETYGTTEDFMRKYRKPAESKKKELQQIQEANKQQMMMIKKKQEEQRALARREIVRLREEEQIERKLKEEQNREKKKLEQKFLANYLLQQQEEKEERIKKEKKEIADFIDRVNQVEASHDEILTRHAQRLLEDAKRNEWPTEPMEAVARNIGKEKFTANMF